MKKKIVTFSCVFPCWPFLDPSGSISDTSILDTEKNTKGFRDKILCFFPHLQNSFRKFCASDANPKRIQLHTEHEILLSSRISTYVFCHFSLIHSFVFASACRKIAQINGAGGRLADNVEVKATQSSCSNRLSWVMDFFLDSLASVSDTSILDTEKMLSRKKENKVSF